MKLLLILLVIILLVLAQFCYGQESNNKPVKELQKTEGFTTFPLEMSYQGLLTTSSGAPAADGSYNLQFDLFSSPGGGISLWAEVHHGVNVQHGTFSVRLGDTTALPKYFYEILFVEVTAVSGPGIIGPVTFSPRTKLAASPYSLGPWLSNNYNVYFPYGNVAIGTNVPYTSLTISGTLGFTNSTNPEMYMFQSGTANADRPIISHSPSYIDFGLKYRDVSDQMIFQSGGSPVMTVDLGAGNNIGIGAAAANPISTTKLHVASSKRYAGYFTSDTAGDNTHVIHGEYIGSTSNDAVGVYGKSAPHDYYGYGGNFLGGFIGASGEVFPTGNQNYFGLWGYVSGGAGLNYGVTGQAYSGAYNVGVYGETNPGPNNYAGYFAGKLSVAAAGSGDTTVVLPNDAISAAEILDESGIARGSNSFSASISTSGTTNVTSASITVPGPGYIVARAHCIGVISGTSIGDMRIGIETSGSNSPTVGEYTVIGSNNEATSGVTRFWSVTPERTFPVGSPGTWTYYLNADRPFTGGTGSLDYSKLVLTYYPTAYGTVSADVPSAQASSFSNAIAVEIPGIGTPKVETTTLYQVDLQQLELKAAKARIAAQQADNELMKARLKITKEKNKWSKNQN